MDQYPELREDLRTLKSQLTEVQVALIGNSMGSKGLVKTLEDHIKLDEIRHDSQISWNNTTDRRIARYAGIGAGLFIAVQLLNVAIDALHKG